jgi:hypothetical protein
MPHHYHFNHKGSALDELDPIDLFSSALNTLISYFTYTLNQKLRQARIQEGHQQSDSSSNAIDGIHGENGKLQDLVN